MFQLWRDQKNIQIIQTRQNCRIKASVVRCLLAKQKALENAFGLGIGAVQRRVFGNVLDKYHSLQSAHTEIEGNIIPERLNNLQRTVLYSLRKTCTRRRQDVQATNMYQEKLKQKCLGAFLLGF